jgi:hypothetical protein
MVVAAGKMALVFVIWAAIVIGSFYLSLGAGQKGLPIYAALLTFVVLILLTGMIGFRTISDMFKGSKRLGPRSQNEWILLITILAAAFAIGGAFQGVSTIGAETVSNSTCSRPTGLNVTSPNCVQVQTITQTQGPFTYLGQLGVTIVLLASMGALAFGILYSALRAGLANIP